MIRLSYCSAAASPKSSHLKRMHTNRDNVDKVDKVNEMKKVDKDKVDKDKVEFLVPSR